MVKATEGKIFEAISQTFQFHICSLRFEKETTAFNIPASFHCCQIFWEDQIISKAKITSTQVITTGNFTEVLSPTFNAEPYNRLHSSSNHA